jgi:hypothetical protein
LDIRCLERKANHPPLSIGRVRRAFKYTSFPHTAFSNVVKKPFLLFFEGNIQARTLLKEYKSGWLDDRV